MRRPLFASLFALSFSAVACNEAPTPGADSTPSIITATKDSLAIAPNNNRRTAGTLANGILTVRLEARDGHWYPDGPSGAALPTAAFAEVGRALETPGPLLRAPVGTKVHATVHNALKKAMWLYGMGVTNGLRGDSIKIAPGATNDIEFTLGRIGTYGYAARTDTVNSLANREHEDPQLSGIIVVDSLNAKPDANERIFAITGWVTFDTTTISGLGPNSALAFNGATFPNNERMEMTQGDSTHWRFVNFVGLEHPLHLHGFYFRVDARGDQNQDTIYQAADRRMAVTEFLPPMQTVALTFSPNRSGHWVFHCHFASHMANPKLFEADHASMVKEVMNMSPASGSGAMNAGGQNHDPMNHMAGLVMAFNVKATGTTAANTDPARPIRMLVRSKAKVYGPNVGYAFVLGGSPAEKNPSIMTVPGPQLELVRGERVAMTIVNESHETAAIHWHGIELESYADGVAGVSGEGASILPHIAPGDSLTVRFTPPRAGTFMYHSHSNELQQISSGLYGALIVREPHAAIDTASDKVMLMSDGGPNSSFLDPTKYPPLLVNGQKAPPPFEVKSALPTRFRIINIRTETGMKVDLLENGKPIQWRIVAKDGMTTPDNQAQPRTATLVMGVGEIYDVEVTAKPGTKLEWKYTTPGVPEKMIPPTVVAMRVH